MVRLLVVALLGCLLNASCMLTQANDQTTQEEPASSNTTDLAKALPAADSQGEKGTVGPQLIDTPFDPWAALDNAECWKLENTSIPLPHGNLEVDSGWAIRPGGVEFAQYVIAGKMLLAFDQLPRPDDETLNAFYVSNQGQPVQFELTNAFVCAGQASQLVSESQFLRPGQYHLKDLDQHTQELLTKAYLRTYHRAGWLDPMDVELPEDAETMPYVLKPDCSYPLEPEPDEFYLAWQTADGNTWEYRSAADRLIVEQTTNSDIAYVAWPKNKPTLITGKTESKRNFTIAGIEKDCDFQHSDPEGEEDNANAPDITLKYDLTVAEPTSELYFNLPLSRSCLAVADGQGNKFEWEAIDRGFRCDKDLVVKGSFKTNSVYRILIEEQVDSHSGGKQESEVYKVSLDTALRPGEAKPPVTIRVRVGDPELRYLAANDAETSIEDDWFSASWPAGIDRHYVIAHRIGQGEYHSSGMQLRYICPPELLGTSELTDNLDALARWLRLRRDVLGPWTLTDSNDYLVQVVHDSGNENAYDPALLVLRAADEPALFERFMGFSAGALSGRIKRFTQEPDYWRDARQDLLVYKAAEELDPDRQEKRRESCYSIFVSRHIDGTAEELLDEGFAKELQYRIAAALIAIDYEADDVLYRDVIIPLRQQALESGELTFDDISAKFMQHPGTPISDWWQRLVLNGEIPPGDSNSDPWQPVLTPERVEQLKQGELLRTATSKLANCDHAGALYYLDQIDSGFLSDSVAWFKIEAKYRLGEYEDALSAISSYQDTNPDSRFIGDMEGEYHAAILFRLGRVDEARQVVEKALNENDHDSAFGDLQQLELMKQVLEN